MRFQIFWGSAFAILFLLASVGWTSNNNQPPICQNSKELKNTLSTASLQAGDYLVRVQKNDGSFIYSLDAKSGQDKNESYNILRHAGTIYSLLELYENTRKPQYLTAATKGLDYLLARSQLCPNSPSKARCIAEKGEVKLGGNALAILAITKHIDATGSNKYLPEAQKLATWIVENQNDSGEIFPHKINSQTGQAYLFVSEYYPGEAAFALARLYKVDQNPRWLAGSKSVINWTINTRDRLKTESDINHDHWLLYALNEINSLSPEKKYQDRAALLVRAISSIQHRDLSGDFAVWNGGYYSPPRSTPTATRSEGLLAAYSLVQNRPEKDLVWEAVAAGINFQLRNQVSMKQQREFSDISIGGFRSSLNQNDIRIDYVQHNISALLGYHKLISVTCQ